MQSNLAHHRLRFARGHVMASLGHWASLGITLGTVHNSFDILAMSKAEERRGKAERDCKDKKGRESFRVGQGDKKDKRETR